MKFTPENYPKSIKQIPLTEIHTADYQRQLRGSNIDKIVKNFDPVGLGSILVSRRDGKYWVFDGQHRLSALRILGFKAIECIVYEGMTYIDEAKAWDYYNLKQNKATKLDEANAKLKRGDAAAIDLNNAVEEIGLSIAYDGSQKQGQIIAISALEKIYNEYGRERLQKVLSLIKGVFGTEKKAYQRFIVLGINEFLLRYENNPNFSEAWLRTRLEKAGFGSFSGYAKDCKFLGRTTSEEGVISATLKIYNTKKRFDNQLR